jgi:putative ABC transport system permease protein
MNTVLQDLRYGLRMLMKNPGFTTVAVVTLALGIGANTAIFSVVNAALLTPVPIPRPDRVVMVWTENAKRGWHHVPASIPDLKDWQQSGVFSSVGALTEGGFNLRVGERTDRIDGYRVTNGVLEVLQAQPHLGRIFSAGDMLPGHNQVAVLGYELWTSRFAGDPSIVGKTIVLDGTPHVVIGVLPRDFIRLGTEQEQIYAPLELSTQQAADRGSRFVVAIGRLRPDVTREAAQQRLTDLSERLAKQYPNEDAGNRAVLQPIEQAFVEDVQSLLLVVFAAVGFVLLIACANVANLLLARGTGRGKEMAIRSALGASRRDLVRQFLTESVLLALIGGVVGILPAVWGIDFLSSFKQLDLPNASLVGLNRNVLFFNLFLSLGTGLLFGLAPAWQARNADLNDILKATGTSRGTASRPRARNLLVISEVALTLMLLVGAGLMVGSLVRRRSADSGFNPRGVLSMKIALSDKQYAAPEKQAAFFEKVLQRVRALPGVESASASDAIPGGDDVHGSGLFFPDRPEPRPNDVPVVLVTSVSDDYFKVLQVSLYRGRYLEENDSKSAPLVAMVDSWTARRYWPNQDAVGRLIKLGRNKPALEIVGVVGDVEPGAWVKLAKGEVGQVYVPLDQNPKPEASLVVRARGDPMTLASGVRQVVHDLDVDQPVFHVQTFDTALAANRAPQHLAALLLGAFSAVALLLATTGIYGVVSYSVEQRTREIGIRVALGAEQRDVLRLVVGQGFVLAAVGLIIGLLGAFGLTRFLSSLLYGVRPTDPATFAGTSVILGGAALLASYLPARRATRVDPVVALRYE